MAWLVFSVHREARLTDGQIHFIAANRKKLHNFLLCIIKSHRMEENVLFNDGLNTFHLQLYGIGHMVKDHSDSERGKPQLSTSWFTLPTDRRANTMAWLLRCWEGKPITFHFMVHTTHRQESKYHGLATLIVREETCYCHSPYPQTE